MFSDPVRRILVNRQGLVFLQSASSALVASLCYNATCAISEGCLRRQIVISKRSDAHLLRLGLAHTTHSTATTYTMATQAPLSDHIGPLRMWRDLTPYPPALQPATHDAPHCLIIGGGVTGLTTAWALLDRGYKARSCGNIRGGTC